VRTHTREDGGSRGREKGPHETNGARTGEEQQPSETVGGRCLRYSGGATAGEGNGAVDPAREEKKRAVSPHQRGVVGFFSSRDNRRRRFMT
jgi:hypothetical protein